MNDLQSAGSVAAEERRDAQWFILGVQKIICLDWLTLINYANWAGWKQMSKVPSYSSQGKAGPLINRATGLPEYNACMMT